jgi:hypothetical protein
MSEEPRKHRLESSIVDDLNSQVPEVGPRVIRLDIKVTDEAGTTEEAHLQAEWLDDLLGQLGTFASWLEMQADAGPARTTLFEASQEVMPDS